MVSLDYTAADRPAPGSQVDPVEYVKTSDGADFTRSVIGMFLRTERSHIRKALPWLLMRGTSPSRGWIRVRMQPD